MLHQHLFHAPVLLKVFSSLSWKCPKVSSFLYAWLNYGPINFYWKYSAKPFTRLCPTSPSFFDLQVYCGKRDPVSAKGLFSKSMKAEWLLVGFDLGAGVAGQGCWWPVNTSALSSIPGREPGAETSKARSLGALPLTTSLSPLYPSLLDHRLLPLPEPQRAAWLVLPLS